MKITKRIITLLCILFYALQPSIAAGPKWLKQATKSMLTLQAIQQRGDTLTANAFFTDEDGTLVAPFKTIQNTRSAWVTDASGNRYEVNRILGFNSTYDVVRLRADMGKKKAAFLPVAVSQPTKGQAIYLMPQATPDEITQVERAGDYGYYTLKTPANPSLAGTPVINNEGEIAAILQAPVSAAKAPNYALDIRLAQSLTIRAIDANHNDLRQCNIPKLLPSDEAQATSFLYLTNSLDASMRQAYAEQFIQQFPKSVTGYVQKAEIQSLNKQYDQAFQTYDEGLRQKTGQDDEILYSRSRVIYNMVLQSPQGLPENWTLQQALTDIEAAKAANPLPLYLLQEANTRYALKQYAEANDIYMGLTRSPMRSPELFLYAWQCQQAMGADKQALLALNDSAVAFFTKPYSAEAAPYLLLRSQTLQELGRVREAISDLNDYEHLAPNQVTAKFYYQREQLEVQTRMYAPAVNDIQRAIQLQPDEPLLHAELASLLFRLRDLDGAINASKQAISLDVNFPDAHRLLGVCLREKGDTVGARQHLQRAVELGDTMAKELLEKL